MPFLLFVLLEHGLVGFAELLILQEQFGDQLLQTRVLSLEFDDTMFVGMDVAAMTTE